MTKHNYYLMQVYGVELLMGFDRSLCWIVVQKIKLYFVSWASCSSAYRHRYMFDPSP